MSASCPGFLDRYGVWNNGFDCSSPRVCCGPEIDRNCCIPSSALSSSTSSSFIQSSDDSDSYNIRSSIGFLPERWFVFQMFTIGLCLALLIIIFTAIYLCRISIRNKKKHHHREKQLSIVQIPLPAASPLLLEQHRPTSNRISTISSTPSDTKTRCTDTSIVLNTPLNLYPTNNSRNSTSTSSSYYMFPNEFEYLCK